MKTLFVLIFTFIIALSLNAINKNDLKKEEKQLNLIFSQMYKHKFSCL